MTWNGAILISGVGNNAIGATVGASGQTVAALYNRVVSGVIREIWAAVSRDGGQSFAPGVLIGPRTGSTTGTTPPACVVGSDGSIYVAWADYQNDPREIWFASCSPAGVWGGPRNLTTLNSNGTALAIGPDGKLHLAYANIHVGGQDAQVEYLTSTDGGLHWSQPTLISGRNGYCNEIAVAVNSAGEVFIAYEYGLLNQYQIFARHTVGGAWQPAEQLSDSAFHHFWPRMAASGQKIGLVWQRNVGGEHVILREWTVDGGWGNAVDVAGPTAFNPSIAYTDVAHICFTDAPSGTDPNAGTLNLMSCSAADNFAAKQMRSPSRSTGVQMAGYHGNIAACYQYDPGGGNWGCYVETFTGTPPPPPPPPTQQFDDVPADRWSYAAVTAVVAAGLMSGETPTHFGATDNMTREQLAVVLARCLTRWH